MRTFFPGHPEGLKRKARKSVGSLLVDVTIACATDVLPLLRPHILPYVFPFARLQVALTLLSGLRHLGQQVRIFRPPHILAAEKPC